ncbi:MAG: NAD(P)H-binding protein [Chloroflexi bacterium]|nr:NAD(P)H-binding protein [Chloroflexota bacterium]MCC6894338.1 NAD(P)H-binding protein [Anaerolineae bacterium]
MKILVTGATGTVGGHIVHQLHAAGHQVLALTRSAAKANFPAGVTVVEGDLTQPATFGAALNGVEAMHLINFGGDDYADLQTGEEIIALAEKAGVKRVTVLLGGAPGQLEELVQKSSLAWTLLQPVEFMDNMLEWAESIRNEGKVRLAFVDRKTAIVHEADIAAVAVAALTQDGHGGKTYPITGREVLSPRKMIATIGEMLGKTIVIDELAPEQAQDEMRAAGQPEELIQFFMWVYGNPPEIGYTVAPTVQDVTGKPARTFAQWAAEHKTAFAEIVTA